MINVTFTKGLVHVVVGGSIGFNSVAEPMAVNHILIESANGNEHVYFGGVSKIIGNLEIRGVSYSQASSLRTFFVDTCRYRTETFSISAILNTDLGSGKNTSVTVRLATEDMAKIFVYNPPGRFNLNIPFTYLRA